VRSSQGFRKPDHRLALHHCRRAGKRNPLIVSFKATFDCAVRAERVPRDWGERAQTTIRKEKTCRSSSEITMSNRLSAP
jgi:hypothetical protein